MVVAQGSVVSVQENSDELILQELDASAARQDLQSFMIFLIPSRQGQMNKRGFYGPVPPKNPMDFDFGTHFDCLWKKSRYVRASRV